MTNIEVENDDINALQRLIMHGGEQAFSLVPLALANVIREKQWQNRLDKHGKPFASFEAFVEHRLWQGLETTIDDLRVFCRKNPEVRKLILRAMKALPGQGIVKGSDATFPGRGVTYNLKRLKRDRPDLFRQVLAGKLSSNAAAIEAGFRKKRRCPKCGHEF